MKIRLKALVPALFVAFSLCVQVTQGQYVKVGISGPIPIGKLDQMQSALDLADKAQQADLLTRLGVDPDRAKRSVEEMLATDKIALLSINSPSKGLYAVVFVPSSVGGFAAIYLLKASADNSATPLWKTIDHQDLDCWGQACSLEVMPRAAKKIDDLLLHHVNQGHGSNYVQDVTEAYIIHEGKLKKTLATTDFVSESTSGADRTVERGSGFLRFPDDSIEETQTVTINDKLSKVRRRFWRWSEPSQKFIATTFVTVSRNSASLQ